nr:hypothetical protein [Desulfobacterales bacterium]
MNIPFKKIAEIRSSVRTSPDLSQRSHKAHGMEDRLTIESKQGRSGIILEDRQQAQVMAVAIEERGKPFRYVVLYGGRTSRVRA